MKNTQVPVVFHHTEQDCLPGVRWGEQFILPQLFCSYFSVKTRQLACILLLKASLYSQCLSSRSFSCTQSEANCRTVEAGGGRAGEAVVYCCPGGEALTAKHTTQTEEKADRQVYLLRTGCTSSRAELTPK